jgi:hypothetical protein
MLERFLTSQLKYLVLWSQNLVYTSDYCSDIFTPIKLERYHDFSLSFWKDNPESCGFIIFPGMNQFF